MKKYNDHFYSFGIDYYPDGALGPLEGAAFDSIEFLRRAEKNQFRVASLNRSIIEDGDFDEDDSIQWLETTQRQIDSLAKAGVATSSVSTESRVVILLAGHGAIGTQSDGSDTSLVLPRFIKSGPTAPEKYDTLSVYSLHQKVVESRKNKFSDLIYFVDTCRIEAPYVSSTKPIYGELGFENHTYIALVACRPRERTYEKKIRDQTRGLFSLAIIEAMEGFAGHQGGVLTLSQLLSYLYQRLPALSKIHHPDKKPQNFSKLFLNPFGFEPNDPNYVMFPVRTDPVNICLHSRIAVEYDVEFVNPHTNTPSTPKSGKLSNGEKVNIELPRDYGYFRVVDKSSRKRLHESRSFWLADALDIPVVLGDV